jgi:hypothetical protein
MGKTFRYGDPMPKFKKKQKKVKIKDIDFAEFEFSKDSKRPLYDFYLYQALNNLEDEK